MTYTTCVTITVDHSTVSDRPTSPAGAPLPGPDHAVDDLGQAVVPRADGAAKVPVPADLAPQHVARQHLPLPLHLSSTFGGIESRESMARIKSFAVHLDHAALLDLVASVPEYLKS